jgi:hypothetical protein
MNGRMQYVETIALNGALAVDTDPVDSAIRHCEKLRRVLELEEWIAAARDDALLVGSCRAWRAEHQQLLAELNLSH